MENEKKYTGYDYKDLVVSRKLEPVWRDSYNSFGWEVEEGRAARKKPVWGPLRVMAAPLALLPGSFFKNMVSGYESEDEMELRLKRDRQIQNKNELNRLQASMEGTLNEMEHMEETKTFGASAAAYAIGLVGTIFMGLSVFSYLAANLQACIVLAVPGFLGWLLPFAAYAVLKKRRERSVSEAMAGKFDELNTICMQAHALVMAE